MRPILSVVVATKNRVKYCIACLEEFLRIPDIDIEIIIQDNTDNLDLKRYIEEEVDDDRLKYRYTPPPFSSIDNFNAAIELASGEYVCLIGDDDAILPDLINIARWAFKNNIDSIAPKNIINYTWPDHSNIGSKLEIPTFTYEYEIVVLEQQLAAYLGDGCAKSFRNYNLPALYHGLVRRSCLEQIKSITGHYVGGLSPDSYSSVALSLVVRSHIVLDYPFTVAGACPASTTIQGSEGNHRGLLQNAPHFRDRGHYVWLKNVPMFYSVETIWSESALRAILELDKLDIMSNFSDRYLFSHALVKNLPIRAIILKYTNLYLKNMRTNALSFYVNSLFIIFKLKFTEHILMRLKSNKYRVKRNVFDNVESIEMAIKLFASCIEERDSHLESDLNNLVYNL
jgi:glycosyltransferase involved in cell wall biosynthesis